MAIELKLASARKRDPNAEVVALLRRLAEQAEQGLITSVAIAFSDAGCPAWDAAIEPGDELSMASTLRTIDEQLRSDWFDGSVSV